MGLAPDDLCLVQPDQCISPACSGIIWIGGFIALAPLNTLYTKLLHQPLCSALGNPDPFTVKLFPHLASAIDAEVLFPDPANVDHQLCITPVLVNKPHHFFTGRSSSALAKNTPIRLPGRRYATGQPFAKGSST
jgi:hypothetical protein